MRKVYEQVRPPTLDELDQAIANARTAMLEHRASGDTALAALNEQAMNRYLEAREARTQQAAS